MKSVFLFFYTATILLIVNNLFAENIFNSQFINIEFQSEEIENSKIQKINELKMYTINSIFKKILNEDVYNKIKKNIDNKFADVFIRNIIIENEKIINNRYSANIKIDFSKNTIIQYLRNNNYSYVDYLPNNYLIIILEQNDIETNLFSKNNSYYKFLLNNDKLIFFQIPNLDINDRFLLTAEDILKKNNNKINKFIDKYNYENIVLVNSLYKDNEYIYNVYTIKDEILFLVDKYKFDNLIYENFFIDLEKRLINFWKANNSIQNIYEHRFECMISALNIYELQKINSLINSISTVSEFKLINISLFNNLYEMKFYGNQKILEKLFYLNSMNINVSKDNCKIKLL